MDIEIQKKNDKLKAVEIINLLKKSKRLHRNRFELDCVRKFLNVYCPALPIKSMSKQEVDVICNEIDMIKSFGRCLLFLQGDYGNRYYMILRGKVALFQTDSNDTIVENARIYGDFRSLEFPGSDEEMEKLGSRVHVLERGSGFGELSILSSSYKFRTASAICQSDDSLIFVMYDKTYNEVLRKYHFRQQELSSTITFLASLPICRNLLFSNLASIAYSMRSTNYPKQTNIVNMGSKIDNVIIVKDGEVHMSNTQYKKVNSCASLGLLRNRIPQMLLCALCKGMILGENDINEGRNYYSHSYTAVVDSSMYELPMKVYRKMLDSYHITSKKDDTAALVESDTVREGILRIMRAEKSIKAFTVDHKWNREVKIELQGMSNKVSLELSRKFM